MPKEYTFEQVLKLLENLPPELKEVFLAANTSERIYSVCQRYGLLDERASKIAEYVGHVLLGVLPSEKLQETLEKKVGLKEGLAENVAREISRFIFYAVEKNLAELYIGKVKAPPKETITTVPLVTETEEKPVPKKKPDVYHEPLE